MTIGFATSAYPWSTTVTKPLTDAEKTDIRTMISAMKQVIAEAGPDYVYQKRNDVFTGGCCYVYNGEPDCLIARVLSKMGVSVSAIKSWEGKAAYHMSPKFDWACIKPIGLLHPTTELLGTAQTFQDNGFPWGRCLSEAIDFAAVNYGMDLS
jgi:hypothetical protein